MNILRFSCRPIRLCSAHRFFFTGLIRQPIRFHQYATLPSALKSYENQKTLLKTIKTNFYILKFLSTTKKNYYEILGLTPKASQSDVKAAYFRLSKVYHPDVCKNDVNAVKFREISEAYEILGNTELRKKYDSDMSSGRKQQEWTTRRRPQGPYSGRSPYYDYDEWTRSHYSRVFERDEELKKWREHYWARKKEAQTEYARVANQLLFVFSFFFVFMLLSLIVEFNFFGSVGDDGEPPPPYVKRIVIDEDELESKKKK